MDTGRGGGGSHGFSMGGSRRKPVFQAPAAPPPPASTTPPVPPTAAPVGTSRPGEPHAFAEPVARAPFGRGTLPDFQQAIIHWEGRDLQGVAVPIEDLSSSPPRVQPQGIVCAASLRGDQRVMWARLRGMARVGGVRQRPDDSITGPAGRVFAGLATGSASLLYLLLGHGAESELYWGVKWPDAGETAAGRSHFDSLSTCLLASYPQLELQPLAGTGEQERLLRRLEPFQAAVSLIGHPWPEAAVVEGQGPADQLIRALTGNHYALFVEATPVDAGALQTAFLDVSRLINEVHQHVNWSESGQQSSVQSQQRQQLNRLAQHYEQLLEAAHQKLAAGLREGAWRVSATLAVEQPQALGRAASLLRAVFAGYESKPQPVGAVWHQPLGSGAAALRQFHSPVPACSRTNPFELGAHCLQTVMTSSEAGLLAELPRQEVCGFRIALARDFSVDVATAAAKTLDLGEVIARTGPTGRRFRVELDDLTRHGLIVGVTGGGKTNTALQLLDQLWTEQSVPFLVIEPAKAQYRTLFEVPGFESLQVFTPGVPQQAPFRLNPFEFAAGTIPQQHISHLNAVFNAAFVLYAPMPYILERALYGVYEERGWDMLAVYHPEADPRTGEPPQLAFPTLADLHRMIGIVVDRLGYDQRIRMDVTAGLQARVDTLRIGQKGQTFDCQRSLPFRALLSQPTVIELAHVGSDEEKAFFMGLLLMRLYQTLELSGERPELRHVTLIEEAHRLLTRVATDSSAAESANVKGKSVETFCNMLAEIRAYGEGLLIAEQIPAKLADDMIKNTNLKVLHRLVAADDRQLMGGAMNLVGRQQMAVTSLRRGEAAIYAEGCESPVLVRVPHYTRAREVADERIQAAGESRVRAHPDVYQPLPGCGTCRHVCQFDGRARRLATTAGVYEAVWAFALAAAFDPATRHNAWRHLANRLVPPRERGTSTPTELEALARCVFAQAALRAFWPLHISHGTPLRSLEDWLKHLGTASHPSPRDEASAPSSPHDLRDRLREITAQHSGPYRGCAHCPHVCACRPLGARLAATPGLRKTLTELVAAGTAPEVQHRLVERQAENLLERTAVQATRSVILCTWVHWAEHNHAEPHRFIAELLLSPSLSGPS